MSRQFTRDFLIEVSKGNVSGHSLVHKFGRNESVSSDTIYEPVSIGAVYQTPQVAGATTLRIKAGNVNDAAGGSGARLITLEGLDETGALVTESIATNGTSNGTASTITFLRLFRAYVAESGTYATSSAGSHSAAIVIENGAGGTTWATIDATNFPRSQTEIAAYSVPLGKTAYMLSYTLTTAGKKSVDILLFMRSSILDTAAPYDAMRLQLEEVGIQDPLNTSVDGGLKFSELTDFGFMVRGATSPDVSIDFDILLIDD